MKKYRDCMVGHTHHDTIKVNTEVGEMVVYDWDKYAGQANYCTGQDDISRTLINTGIWEPTIFPVFKDILIAGDRHNIVVDIGSNVGWYSLIAYMLGYNVDAYDGNEEHISVLKQNVPHNITVQNLWFDANTPKIVSDKTVEILKCDIEGNEKYAVEAFTYQLERKLIKNILMEITPVFNDSYPELVSKLVGYGFEVFEINGEPFNFRYDFNQKDLIFKLK